MDKPTKSRFRHRVLAAIAIMVAGLYVTGHFWLSETVKVNEGVYGVHADEPVTILRIFPNKWLATLYGPTSWLEGKRRGTEVRASWPKTDEDLLTSEELEKLRRPSPIQDHPKP